jgi:hypothetical protein
MLNPRYMRKVPKPFLSMKRWSEELVEVYELFKMKFVPKNKL